VIVVLSNLLFFLKIIFLYISSIYHFFCFYFLSFIHSLFCNFFKFSLRQNIFKKLFIFDLFIDRQWYLYRNETEMKKEQRIESKKNREWICLYKETEDEIHALLHYCFCLSVYITHPQFIYAVLERYHTKNVHSI